MRYTFDNVAQSHAMLRQEKEGWSRAVGAINLPSQLSNLKPNGTLKQVMEVEPKKNPVANPDVKIDEKDMKIDEKDVKIDEKDVKIDEKDVKIDEKDVKSDEKQVCF